MKKISLIALAFIFCFQAQAQVNWTARTSAADSDWYNVAYGNGLFVAIAGSGAGSQVMTSPDGIAWTARTAPTGSDWYSITYGNGLFVAVAFSGTNQVMTSPDGITWTVRTAAAAYQWRSVTYGNGLFVAVASSGAGDRVMTSTDGITWTARASAADNNWGSVTYGNGVFVAVSFDGTNRVMTSPNGITWTAQTASVNNAWYGITYGKGLFVATAVEVGPFTSGSGNRVMTSPDGITWTTRTSAEDNTWYSVTYGNGIFVALSYDGVNQVMTSTDGITWTAGPAVVTNAWNGVIYGNGLFVAVASTGTGNRVMTANAAVSRLTIDAIANQTYTGAPLTPAIVVKDDNTILTLGTHYSVAYSNNTNPGTATVTITGMGNYTGTKTETFSIAVPLPTITSFTPTTAATGATVTVTGTNFTGATAVSFGGTAATSFNVVSATSITAVLATGTSGNVSVTTPSGTAVLAGFTFIPAPVINSFSPASGSVGTLVTITGTNLGTPTAFTIGGTAAIVISNTGTSLVGMVMPGSATGTISLTTAGGSATSAATFTLSATTAPNTQQGTKLVGTGISGSATLGFTVSLSADGSTAIVGGYNDNSFRGAAWIFTRSGATWSQQGAKLVASDGGNFTGANATKNSRLGFSVSLSADGNTAIVGGYSDNANRGAAWIFTRSGTTWSQQGNKLVGSGAIGFSMQGYAVSISADGNTAIVGGSEDNSNRGAVWIYTRSGTTWTQQGTKLVGTGIIATYARQGSSVSLSADGNTAIVGGISDNGAKGAAWIFTRSGSTWTQQEKLVGTGGNGNGAQGQAVSLSADGNTAIVGAYLDNSAQGAAWIFTRSGTTWSQQGAKLVGTGNTGAARQGRAVSLSADGNTAIVSGSDDNSFKGAAWIYTRNGTTWSQLGDKLVGTGAVGNAYQGHGVSLSADGTTAMVGGGSDNSSQGAVWVYNYVQPPAPTITSFTPTSAVTGATVTITGTDFTGATAVSFGGTAATSYTVVSSTSITAVLPATTSGNVSVTTWGGTAVLAGFTFIPTPVITSFTPTSAATGATVTLTGTNFTGATAVSFGGTAATSFNVVSATSITAVLAAGTSGNVSVTNPDGTGALAGFTFIPAPVITSFTPTNAGPTATVTLTGTNFTGATAVSFGGTTATSFNVVSATSITAVVAAGASGNVSVTTPGGTGVLAGFTFFPAPVITSFTPTSAATGATVTLTGTDFTGATAVSFGGIAATSFNVVSATSITAVVSALGASGNVSVTTPGGTGVLAGFNFPAPVITSFSPASGPVGTLVTITGTNLGTPTAFTIGGTAAIVISNTGTSLVGMVMPGAVTGTLSLTTASGSTSSATTFMLSAIPAPILQQGDKLVGTANTGAAGQGYAVSISADGTTAIVGGLFDNLDQGAAWIYTRSGTTWTQQGTKLVGTGAVGTSQQGVAVSLSADGNTAIVGGNEDDGLKGAAWIFTRSGATWTQQGAKLVGTGAVGTAQQGRSVSLSADGNTAIVGGSTDNSSQGAVWIFTRSGTTWTQQGAKLVGTGAIGTAQQGRSVSLSADGNTAIVGGYFDNTGQGAVWIFTRSGTTWTQQGAKLVGTGAVGAARQGQAVSLSADGTTAIVGGNADNFITQGAAWIFTRSGATWSQQGTKLVGTGTTGAAAGQGWAVSLSADGNTAILGGYADNSDQGAGWIFTRSGTTWTQQGAKLVGTGAVGTARQGWAVSLSADGTTAILGGYKDNSDQGAVWVYTYTPPPTITSATYNASTGVLVVTGANLVATAGATNDIDATKLTFTGQGGSTFTLTSNTTNVEITNGTSFTVSLGTTDKTSVNALLNKNGTSSIGGTTYTIAAAEDWNAGADPALVIADLIGNGITVSNVATITTTGTLTALTTTYATASSTTSFSVSGASLTNDITVTAPTGFEVSVSTTSGFGNTVTLTQTSGTVSITTVYVRVKSNSTVAGSPYSGDVTCTSTNAQTVNVATVSSTVTALGLTITGVTASNKEYDANTNATLGGTATLVGVAIADQANVTLAGTATATFNNASAGTSKAVSVTGYTLGGTAAGNYTVSQPTGVIANITAKGLTINGLTASNKEYDANTNATLGGTATLVGVVTADQANVTLAGTATATFNNASVGTSKAVTVTGYTLGGTAAGNYTVSQPTGLTANISAKAASTLSIDPIANQNYTGAAISPSVVVKDGVTTLTLGTDYSVAYTSNTNVGTAMVTITGIGVYTGTKTKTFAIVSKAVSTLTIDPIANQNFTGTAISLSVVVKDGATTLTLGTDYSVAYSNNTNVGTATVTITGMGVYTGTKTQTFAIVSKAVGTLTIDPIANQNFTGAAISPTVLVKDGSSTLTLGTDYTVAYGNNINVGTAMVTITGMGTYTGTKTQPFSIVPKAASTLTIDAIASQTFTGSAITPTAVVKDRSTTLTLGTDYSVAYTSNTNAGTATVTITGTGNYSGDNPQTFTIVPKAVILRANNASKIYGDANPSLSFSYSGLVAGDTEIDQVPTISTATSTTSGVGNYPITLVGGSDPNYTLTLVEGVLEVSPAPLSLAVNNASKIYGQADPVYTYSLQGLKGSDTEAVLGGAFSRETGEDPGTYRISQGSLGAGANYTLTITGASLQILKARALSVAQLALVTTAWSKEPALPATVKVLAAHGQDFQVEVKWDKSTMNLLARGTYSLTGRLLLPAGIENPDQILAKIQVQVLPKPAPRDVTITNDTFVGSTTSFFISVGDFVINDPVDNIHVVSLLGDGYDNTYFQIKDNILFWNSAERASGKTSFSIVVRVTDRDGNTLDKFFEINRTRPDFSTVTIFNTFTPNGDRFNDTWGVPEVRFYEGVRISVYERGGGRVFYTENPDVRWDGTFEGKELPIGSYFWVIQIDETGLTRRGMVNLMRK